MRLDDYTSHPKQVPMGLPQGLPLLVILYSGLIILYIICNLEWLSLVSM